MGALALAALVGALPSADAAVYRGRYTPDYGAPFKDLYWNGTLEVSVPDSCIPANGGQVSIGTCQGMAITEATVNLYNKDAYHAALDPSTVTPIYTMPFGAAGWNGLNWLLDFDQYGNLQGATSTAFPAIQADADDFETLYNNEPAWFSLQFLGNYAQLYWFDKEPKEHSYFGVIVPDEVVLTAGLTFDNPFWGPPTITIGGVCRVYGGTAITGSLAGYVNPDHCGWSNPDGIDSKVGAFITFERVPEPATLALVPAALAAMGLVGALTKRRRRHSVA